MGGIIGRYFREFAVTLSVAILVSLALSLTTTPMMCSRLLRPARERRRSRLFDASEHGFAKVLLGYERSLAWALDRRSILKLGLVGACAALRDVVRVRRASAQGAPAIDQRERHLTDLRQLTFGGQNAEAYFDRAGTRLVFQSTRPPFGCDQIFTMRDDGGEARLVSTGRGRTTCGFFTPDGRKLIYASTHLGGDACPAPPDRSLWASSARNSNRRAPR